MSTGRRVPAALHHELTEYSYLLRALRTQHVLDLSAHLSQAPSGQRSEIISGRENEDDGSLSVEEDDGGAFMSKNIEADSTTQQREDQPSVAPTPQDEHQQDATIKRKRKSKLTKTYTWTHWPLLAGDINRPEFDLIDEVQLVASHVLKKRKITHKVDGEDRTANNESSSDVSDSEDELGDDEYEEEELDNIASRAIAASTEGYLRSLLSACSTLVPQVSISRRDRVTALSWVSVLSAAAACRLVSPEALERAGLRLQALYGDKQTAASVPISEQITEAKPYTLPRSIENHIHALRRVKASQDRRDALLEERRKQGDGDVLSFVMPPRKKKKTPTRKVQTHVKEETNVEETALKNEERKGEMDEEESQTSELELDELDTSRSEAGDKGK